MRHASPVCCSGLAGFERSRRHDAGGLVQKAALPFNLLSVEDRNRVIFLVLGVLRIGREGQCLAMVRDRSYGGADGLASQLHGAADGRVVNLLESDRVPTR